MTILTELYGQHYRKAQRMLKMRIPYYFPGLIAQSKRTRSLACFAALQWSVNVIAVNSE